MKVIKPNDIELGKQFEPKLHSPIDAVSKLVNIDQEHIQHVKSEYDGDLVDCNMHPFVQAVHHAYDKHLPLVITPDVIWYCISSAFAIHINKHSEELRKTFVDHEGKKVIEIRRDNFVFGSKTNPWGEAVDEFCLKIKELTKSDIVDKLQADYSTTSKVARVVSQIVIMDAMQQYFEYRCGTMCGIPEVRLLGEKEDWERIKKRANEMVELMPKLQHWINSLNFILDQFISVYDEKIDLEFWNEIYKMVGMSGGPFIHGWIIMLFPYLNMQQENYYCFEGEVWKNGSGEYSRLHANSFKYHMNQVPFIWDYYKTEIKMLFIGGLLGVKVDKSDLALTPVFGYAVTEDKLRVQK